MTRRAVLFFVRAIRSGVPLVVAAWSVILGGAQAGAQEASGRSDGDVILELGAEGAELDPRDEIFMRLSSEDPVVSARAQREIVAIWRESGSASTDLLILRGERAAKSEHWDRAERHLTQAVNLDPEFAMGWMLRGGVRFRAGKLGLALGDVAETLRLEPRQYEALLLAALIFVQLDEKEEALAAARAALAINPHLEEAQKIVDRLEPEVEGVEA